MAITSSDGLIAGAQPPLSFTKTTFTGEASGNHHNLIAVAGIPGPATLGTPGMGGVAVDKDSSIAGMFAFTNPSSGNAYLLRYGGAAGFNIALVTLYDLLWYQSGIAVTTTTAQTINSANWPSRDRNGSTNGDGVEIWLYAQVATTNATPITNTTLSYTNSDNTSGRSAGLVYPWPATAVAGTWVPFGWQAGDKGVRSIQSVTLGTSYGAGTVNLMAIRRITSGALPATTLGFNLDAFGCGMPRLYDGSALYLSAFITATSIGITTGDLAMAHG